MRTDCLPLVTVVVPARDEVRWIAACLDSLQTQDYPHDRLEVVVVVDGASTDATERIALELLDGSDFARSAVLVNPHGGTPENLNAGLVAARGDVLCRVDARSRIPPGYVHRCVSVLTEHADVVVVGGAQVAVPSRNDALGTGIARALNNRWGMGLSRYRRDAQSGPTDTVYLGVFRTAELRAAGGWDPDFSTNQDFELNRRLATTGIVWFEAGIPVEYIPRPGLRSLYRQYVRFGAWKVRYWRRTGDHPRPRQLALLAGVPAMAGLAVVGLGTGPLPRRLSVAAALALAVSFVEVRGSRRPHGGPVTHATATAALAAVALGWLRGVWGELLRPSGDARGPRVVEGGGGSGS
jgi:succinoglycan biosynthesis protein ExoA